MRDRIGGAERADHAGEVAQLREALQEMEHEVEGLRIAIQTRGIIEQAKGMLMLQRQCDEDTAFRELVKLSQTSHRKLVEVARALVEAWTVGEHGSA